MTARMAVVIDYQNVHLTASKLFLPGRPIEEGLIEPYRFAKQLAKARNKDGQHESEVCRVEVFRGLAPLGPRLAPAKPSRVRVRDSN